jgi:hypothetical protein
MEKVKLKVKYATRARERKSAKNVCILERDREREIEQG